jgi:hypothetical protein
MRFWTNLWKIPVLMIILLCPLSLASAANPSPLENAYISVNGDNGDGFSITGLNGIFNITQGLGTGNYTVEVRHEGYISRMLDTTIVSGAETDLGDIGLAISGKLEGVVQNPDGNPISNVSVACKDESNNHAVDYAVTSIDGSFLFDTDIKNGTYTVEARACAGYASNSTTGIEGLEGQTTSGVVVQLKPSGTILGTVKDKSNVPIENVSIIASPWDGSGALFYGGFATTDSQGAYSIDSNLPAGKYKVYVTDTKGFVLEYSMGIPSRLIDYQNATVTAGLNTTVDFALDHSGIISGAVTLTGGAPAPNVGVFAVCLRPPHAIKYFGGETTDSAGLYRIDSGLGTGQYRVTAGSDSDYYQTVNVTAGVETPNVDFQITESAAALAWITGTVTNSTASSLFSAELEATGEGIFVFSHTEDNGTYTMEIELPEGQNSAQLILTASANGYVSLSQNVTVNLGQTTSNVDFALRTIQSGTLTGRVVVLIMDTVPPTVTSVTQTPSQGNVLPQDIVVVNATVTDDATGVKEVALNFTTGNGTWITTAMSNLGGNEWSASIPSFPLGTNVTYIILAEDNMGNLVSTLGITYENNYLVVPEFPILTILLPSCAISSVLAIILRKKRKT